MVLHCFSSSSVRLLAIATIFIGGKFRNKANSSIRIFSWVAIICLTRTQAMLRFILLTTFWLFFAVQSRYWSAI
ncbi:unknown protein [Microcystis aeruginosa NIES-843]|uniref:Uncharacterized protein n=1 Tax=Microcystis aeruginosa (strain NIES-843 / IAM M-2473) TaxID=449447 RepID=B0JMB3_MICAN|nr:unknown protein [Microcystis aeruginosa NIES-843]